MPITDLTLTCPSQRDERTNGTTDPHTLSIQQQIWGFFCVDATTAVPHQDKDAWNAAYAQDFTFKALQAKDGYAREEMLSVTFMDVSGRKIRADIYANQGQVFLGTLGQYDPDTGRAHFCYHGTCTFQALLDYLERIPNLHDLTAP